MNTSYQNDAKFDLEMNEEERTAPSSSSPTWRYLTIVSIIGATAMFAYTAAGGYQAYTTEQRLALVQTGRGNVRYSGLTDDEKLKLFNLFKSKFSRKYETPDEENARYMNFLEFLGNAESRNDAESKKGGSAIHGVTKFADRSEVEFKKLLGRNKPPAPPSVKTNSVKVTIDDYDPAAIAAADGTVDWSSVLTTAIKDQGYCGSCWAFSATSQIESDAIRAGILTTSDYLSEQQIVSCDTSDAGCNGGYTEYAYTYVYGAGGLVSETSYPYTSYWDSTGTCTSTTSMTKLVTVTDGTYYTLDSEETMAAHVKTTGPLSVCLDASSWSSYTSGVVSTCTNDVDHCVQAVGLNTEADTPYWIVRNSWGTEWGLEGFIYIEYGSDMCSISYDPTYVEVSSVSTSTPDVNTPDVNTPPDNTPVHP